MRIRLDFIVRDDKITSCEAAALDDHDDVILAGAGVTPEKALMAAITNGFADGDDENERVGFAIGVLANLRKRLGVVNADGAA